MRSPVGSSTGTTISERARASHAMWPGNSLTSGTTMVRLSAAVTVLGVTGTRRMTALPNVPTALEQGFKKQDLLTPEADLETTKCSLIWTHQKLLARFCDTIESRPEVAKAVVDQRAYRSHLGDLVVDPGEDRVYVRRELGIGSGLG